MKSVTKKNSITSVFKSSETLDLDVSTEITVQQAKEYINDKSNPEIYRNKINDLLTRYHSSSKKYPERVLMIVDRLGGCHLWMD